MTLTVEPTLTRNNQAVNALVFGVVSIIFALATNAPGQISFLGLLSPIAALIAVISGIRALGRVGGQQRALAIMGIVAGIVGAILFVIFFVAQTNSAMKSFLPQTFKGGGIQLTYPGSWQAVDMSQSPTCKQTTFTCIFTVALSDGTNVGIVRVAVPAGTIMNADFDAQVWQSSQSSLPGAKRTSNDMITIGGQPADQWLLDMPSQSTGKSSGHDYMLQVHVIKGTLFYSITGFASTADNLKLHRAEIDSIINSISFTS